MTESNKPATWFWVVSALALLWNLMGVMAYLSQVMMTPEAIQAMPENERALRASTPAWATSAFAIAVWGSTLGCLVLLLRKKLATPILIVSYAGVLVQMGHAFFMSKSFEVYGPGGMVMPVMVLVIGALLIWFSMKAAERGWVK
jgi:hypothetical protein